MKSVSTAVVAAALLVAGVSAQFQINTPNPPTQCVPVQLTWSGGNRGQPGAAALQQYSGLTGTSFTWPTNITSGTSIGFTLTDSTGATAQSAPVTINPGPDSSCLNGGSASSSASGATSGASTSATAPVTSASGATSASGTTSGAATTAGSSKPASGTTSGSASGTASHASSSSSSTATAGAGNGAFSNIASAGLVGIVGAIAAAILA
ncbi:hypothetical protein BD310DRAFT_949015 [Dichomitus squalens]|uniref:Ser-Thr-rich glycosyl-phosphatidyl-inositol-anchored membrane family-domain-containing protein n=1 Tax=Dichomitus squalens TaxID=114155 RepID=A0A4Q9PU68_9APHY|nr:hypothetical protein BD310DRAFT_949015 [Dichomitus squalens]